MERNTAAERLAFALGAAGLSATDLVKRENYATDAEYYVALGQMGAALDDPKVRSAILKAEREQQDREFEAERKAQNERIRERAESWKLSDEQLDAIQSRAAAQAAREFSAGDLGNKSIAQRQREIEKELARKEKIAAVSNEFANKMIRDAWRNPTEAERTFVDRIVNRPVVDQDA